MFTNYTLDMTMRSNTCFKALKPCLYAYYSVLSNRFHTYPPECVVLIYVLVFLSFFCVLKIRRLSNEVDGIRSEYSTLRSKYLTLSARHCNLMNSRKPRVHIKVNRDNKAEIKRPLSSYMQSIKKQYPETDHCEFKPKLCEMWKALPEDKKKKYVEQSSADKQRYSTEMRNYPRKCDSKPSLEITYSRSSKRKCAPYKIVDWSGSDSEVDRESDSDYDE
jgi:hypothetical protein